MKKFYYSFIITILAFVSLFVIVTSCRKYIDTTTVEPPIDLICTLNITGGCLDQWVSVNDGYDNICMEPAGNYLRTLNYLYTLPASAGGPGPITTDSTSDSYSGKAALLITGTFSPQGTALLIPGLVGTDSLDIPNATIRLGKRCTSKPLRFNGYYKYQPIAGDSAMISIVLSKYNIAASKRDTIGFVKQIYKNIVNTYTPIDLPILYNPDYITYTPDTLTLLVCSSAGINFSDLFACKGQVGSKMWIDEISFVMP